MHPNFQTRALQKIQRTRALRAPRSASCPYEGEVFLALSPDVLKTFLNVIENIFNDSLWRRKYLVNVKQLKGSFISEWCNTFQGLVFRVYQSAVMQKYQR